MLWLRPQALLGALVWQTREKNPWLNLARDAVLEHVRPVDALAPTCGPGPFHGGRRNDGGHRRVPLPRTRLERRAVILIGVLGIQLNSQSFSTKSFEPSRNQPSS
jgi:hypothetical protein